MECCDTDGGRWLKQLYMSLETLKARCVTWYSSIGAPFSQTVPESSAKSAANAYRALFTSFAEGGMMEIEWTPRIVVEVGDRLSRSS